MALAKIDGHPDLIRDEKTNSIINTNEEEYSKYLNATKNKIQEQKRIELVEHELDTIKNEINEVKHLLQRLLSSCSHN
jgi:ABC-type Mn2+/Zn2+ transport system ATPase subunit